MSLTCHFRADFVTVLFYLGLGGLALAPGCQSSSSEIARSNPAALAAKRNLSLLPGRLAFDFNPKSVEEITLAKTDPITGDTWLATFANKNSLWTIVAAPANTSLIDRIANDVFINHLIDTLAALRLQDNPMTGPPQAMGLRPSRFSVKWRTPTAEFKFFLGALVGDHSGRRYISLDDSKVDIAAGSSLAMLDQIDSFQFLRNRTWTLLNADDVDEIELLRGGKPFFYAQREGESWTDRAHRPIQRDVNALLSKLTATPLESFVDDATQKAQIEKSGFKQAYSEARLIDRFGKVTSLKTTELHGITYGINSTRPEGLFVMPKAILTAMRLHP
jgi:hypothetical protein